MVRCSGARDAFVNHASMGRGAAPTEKYAFEGHKGHLLVVWPDGEYFAITQPRTNVQIVSI